MGQTKYVQTYIEQILTNNRDFPYHRRMTQLLNRTVRTYDESTGKSAVAQDEILEVMNRNLSQMPPVRTLGGRICQGGVVGITRRCKRMFSLYFDRLMTTNVYHHTSGSKGNHNLEKDLLFEVAFLFLGNLFHEADKHGNTDIKRSLDKNAVSCLNE